MMRQSSFHACYVGLWLSEMNVDNKYAIYQIIGLDEMYILAWIENHRMEKLMIITIFILF
jgi:hypothetical protein